MDSVIIDGLAFALPLFVIAIGGIYSERSGITNLALEGMLGAGAFFGAFGVILLTRFADVSHSLFYYAMLIAFIGGAAFASLHAVLCIKFKANQVVSGVVVNILAIALTTFVTSQINASVFDKPSDRFQLDVAPKFSIPVLSDIPVLGAFFRDMYVFVPIILVIAAVAWYAMYRTRFGLRLRACGDNPHAVDSAGGNVARSRFIAVMLSGGLAGVGGIAFAYSILTNFSPAIYAGYGYLSIAALIFGNWRITPTLAACLLFGFARSGGYRIAQLLELPSTFSDLIMILPYLVTLLLLVFFSKTNRAPRALGEIYDKGKR